MGASELGPRRDQDRDTGAPGGSPVPTCRQPAAHLSPLTLCIVTAVTSLPPPPPHTPRAACVPSKTVKQRTPMVLSHQVTAVGGIGTVRKDSGVVGAAGGGWHP